MNSNSFNPICNNPPPFSMIGIGQQTQRNINRIVNNNCYNSNCQPSTTLQVNSSANSTANSTVTSTIASQPSSNYIALQIKKSANDLYLNIYVPPKEHVANFKEYNLLQANYGIKNDDNKSKHAL